MNVKNNEILGNMSSPQCLCSMPERPLLVRSVCHFRGTSCVCAFAKFAWLFLKLEVFLDIKNKTQRNLLHARASTFA
jgi:hypothetical protein